MPDEITQSAVEHAPEATETAAGAQVSGSAPTLAEGAETDAQTPSYWPEDWRDRFAGNTDPKLRQHLNRFTSPEGIFKAWRSYEKKRNDGALKPTRPDTDDPAALTAWRKEVGVPETADGYFQHLGRDVADAERPGLQRMFNRMHGLGVPPDQAKDVIAEYYAMTEETVKAREEADSKFYVDSQEELRSEWGPEYRQNLGCISVMMQQYGSDGLFEKLNDARYADGRKVADDPDTMKFLASLAREIVPDGNVIVGPGSGIDRGAAMADEMAQLEREMQDTRGRNPDGYWKNPAKQARYGELLAAQERMQRRGR